MKNFSKKELLSIPNLMGYFRLLMIPAFAWLYLTASTDMDYYMAALVMGISSLTDMFDGMVARKFNMITEFGKFLDPLADKLSHGAILLCLLSRYPLILLMLVLYVIKEGFMLVMGILKLRQGKKLNGAKWFGKCCTALLYVVLFIFLLFPRLPLGIVNGLIYLCAAAMALTLALYIPVFRFLQVLRLQPLLIGPHRRNQPPGTQRPGIPVSW